MDSANWYTTLFVLAIACATDLRSRRIPNWLVLPFLLVGLLMPFTGWVSLTWQESISGFALATVICSVLCWLRGMGMGDLKLCAAIGAWIGPDQMIVALVMTGIFGGVMAILWAMRYGALRESFAGAGDLLLSWRTGIRPHKTLNLRNPLKLKMPYAPAIALGTVFSFFSV